MKGIIYKWVNKENNKVYIGQTIRKLSTRIKEHIRDSYKDEYPLHRAIIKYGINSFNIAVIETVEADTKEELITKLNKLEIYYIQEYNSLIPNGYNIEQGGNNKSTHKIDKSYIIPNIKDASIIDTLTRIEYENVYSWLTCCNLDIFEQYNLDNSEYRFQIIYPELYLSWKECYAQGTTIADILNKTAKCAFSIEQDEKIQKNNDDIIELKKENAQMKAELEELKRKLNTKNTYIL